MSRRRKERQESKMQGSKTAWRLIYVSTNFQTYHHCVSSSRNWSSSFSQVLKIIQVIIQLYRPSNWNCIIQKKHMISIRRPTTWLWETWKVSSIPWTADQFLSVRSQGNSFSTCHNLSLVKLALHVMKMIYDISPTNTMKSLTVLIILPTTVATRGFLHAWVDVMNLKMGQDMKLAKLIIQRGEKVSN